MDHQGERSEGRATEEGSFCMTREELVDCVVVRVVGDLDMATALELRSALRPDGGRPIVIDLRRCMPAPGARDSANTFQPECLGVMGSSVSPLAPPHRSAVRRVAHSCRSGPRQVSR